jgi:helicase MOV-10
MVQACSSLLATGACQSANCTQNHVVKFCQSCRLICQDANSYESHLRGSRHTARLKHSSINVFCTTCDKNLVATSWDSHIQGQKHLKASQKARRAPQIQPQEGRPPLGGLHCKFCNSDVKFSGWQAHNSNPTHRKREQYFLLKAGSDVAINDKGGAIILPPEELDFGTVEPADARQGITKQLVIQVTDPSISYKLAQVIITGPPSKRNTT